MRLLPLQYVKNGAILGKDLYDNNSRVLLRKGATISISIKEKINDMGIYSVYIDDGLSDVELEDIIKPQLRNRAVNTIKNMYTSYQNFDISDENSVKKLEKDREERLKDINNISEDIIEDILHNDNIVINLVDIKNKDDYMFQHSINVAVLSLAIGKKLGLNNKELKYLCVGAMLHDIGKVFIPNEIIKKDNISKEEREIIKTHTIRGYDFLRDSYEISGFSRIIVFQHHERIDGKGYPKAVKGEKINKFSKIVSIANKYDNLTSNNHDNKAFTQNEAIEYIMASASTEFDYDIAKVFIDNIIPYPVGTLVELSDGRLAIVKKMNDDSLKRPIVNIYNSDIEINLSEVNNIVINRTVFELPE